MQPEPTVFVVDDDQAVRKSLQWLVESIGLTVVTFGSASEFLVTYAEDQPGCLVTDVRMPGLSGLELQDALAARGIKIPVIVVTGFGDVPTAVKAMKKGAVDFIEKPFNDQAMLDLIQTSIKRDALDRAQRVHRDSVLSRRNSLTSREKEVMECVVSGLSNKGIARELGISPKTVEVHRARVMEKMEAGSVAELVKFCSST